MFAQAENTRDQGDLENAARLFGRSAGTWRSSGDVLEAADAYIELGSVLLSQGRGQLLPDLAARLLNLLEAKPLPEGSHLKLRVFAALIARGATNRDAVLDLALERRLGRVRVARAEGIEEHSWERGVA
ncbi:MAG TPA: hypothetical protein VGS22_28920 [Thermoanaerobaculia bacterium]|nr:hypothetical protein [Thermoanaerobaculia bacterium]